MRTLKDESDQGVFIISCDLCEKDIGTERPNAMGTPTNNLSDSVITLGTETNERHICESCRYAGAEQHPAEQKLLIRVGQNLDPETWDNVKEHFNTEELDLANITVGKEGEAVLVWTFEMDKTHARKLGVMLQMVAGLGNPQGGLDMEPSKRELWSEY